MLSTHDSSICTYVLHIKLHQMFIVNYRDETFGMYECIISSLFE